MPITPAASTTWLRASVASAVTIGLVAMTSPAIAADTHRTATGDRLTPQQAARAFLASGADARVAGTDLRHASTARTNGTVVERFSQYYQGIPVLGAQYVVRLNRQSTSRPVVDGGNGDVFSSLNVNTTLKPSYGRAAAVVADEIGTSIRRAQVEDHGLVILPTGTGVVTRHVTLTGVDAEGRLVKREYYVGFGGSKPLLAYDSIDYSDGPVSTSGAGFHGPNLPLELYQSGSSYQFRDQSKPMYAGHGGELLSYDANGADMDDVLTRDGSIKPSLLPASTDTVPVTPAVNKYGLVDAAWGAGRVYDFYKDLGRDSLDGKGGTINSLVGVTSGGRPFPNAFWDGHAMVYGTGGFGYKPFPSSLDVVGHEMTHGVVEHTAGLIGFGQPGAINEGIADYFGNAIENEALGIHTSDRDSGLMGQTLCWTRTGADCAIRDLNELLTTSTMKGDPADGGGVHEDSTVISGALWDIRQALGDDLADQVVYKALSEYFTPLTDFLHVRYYVLDAARALGATNAQLDIIKRAFDRHGVVRGWEKQAFDSAALITDTMGGQVNVGGGQYVLGRFGAKGSAIVAGPIDGHQGPRVVASSWRKWLDNAATDGARVLWSSHGFEHNKPVTKLQTRRFGGPVRTLATYPNFATIQATGISGDTMAWTVGSFNGTSLSYVHRSYARRPNGRIVELPKPVKGSADQVFVRGTDVVYVTSTGRSDASDDQLRLYDARTGRSRVLTTTNKITSPVLTTRRVVYLQGGQSPLPWMPGRATVVRIDLDGTHRTVLVSRDSGLAPLATTLGASDDWVAYDSGTRANVMALSLRGGRNLRVSCSRGLQYGPNVTMENRFVFFDTTALRLDLRSRATPAGSC